MNENDTPTNKQNGDDAPLFPARTFPAVYLTPGDHPPAPPMQLTDEQQKTLDKIKADAAAAHERAGAGIEAALEKAEERVIEINRALVRLVEMLKSKDKAHLAESVDGFLLRLKDGDGGEPLVFDALLLGAELGADTDTGNLLRQILANQAKTEPYLAGVPAVVEQANENIREGMGELYRVLYAPGMTARQKVIADAMRQAKGVVREAARLLQLDSAWRSKGVSVSTISRELDKMDMLFADAKMTNPFASREHNRKRPVVDNPCRKRKVDSDDPDSAVEIVPTRPGGYGSDETDDETP